MKQSLCTLVSDTLTYQQTTTAELRFLRNVFLGKPEVSSIDNMYKVNLTEHELQLCKLCLISNMIGNVRIK